MPANIEIKARVADFSAKRALAERLSGGSPTVLRQEDTFFPCPRGRLKLRQFSESEGELIYYVRPDATGPKQSDYEIYRTTAPSGLRHVLAAAYGTGVVVRKERLLYLVGQTRIHLDRVESLGTFIELEVVLRPDQSAVEGQRIAEELMNALNIREADLLDGAYADLLASPPVLSSICDA